MPVYVDGYVIPIPTRNLPAYKRMARMSAKVWREHGALEYRECVGDDLSMPGMLGFPRGIRARKGETVLFSWITYRSRAHRDRVNAKVMNDPRMHQLMKDGKCPFDMKRMLFGGFKTIVSG